jgi:Mannosyltransferase (PIG-V)
MRQPVASSPPLPRWATALDLLSLVLIGLAAVILAFGGVRLRVAGLRVSLMSPERILVWATVASVVRHVLVRRDPLYRRALLWLQALRRSDAMGAAWPVFLITRLAVLVIGYFAVATVGYPERVPPFRIYENELRNLPARWDTGWYISIASAGYSWSPEVTGQQKIAFFPAYPILMRMVGRLFNDQTLWAGVIVSLGAFLAALVYFYKLAREWLEPDAARAALLLLAAYPFALFYSAAYTESLFLLAAVAAFYHFRRDELLWASAWGLVAGLTRPNGCLLSIALGLVLVERGWRDVRFNRRTFARLAAVAMPVVGLAIFSAFILRLTGNPFEWARSHAAWGRTYEGVHRVVLDRYDFISEYGIYEYTKSLPIDVMNGVAAAFSLALVWPVWRFLGASAASFILLNLLPPLAVGGLLSIGRVTAVLFPMFIWLGRAIRPERRQIWVLGFAMVQAFFAVLFFTWRPLF